MILLTFDLERVPPVESIQMYLCKGLDFERGEKSIPLISLLCHGRSLLVERHVFHELQCSKEAVSTCILVAPIAGCERGKNGKNLRSPCRKQLLSQP